MTKRKVPRHGMSGVWVVDDEATVGATVGVNLYHADGSLVSASDLGGSGGVLGPAVDWAQLTSVPATFAPSAHTHPAGDITSGTFDNARIAASNVTQHQSALSIAWSQLTGLPFLTGSATWDPPSVAAAASTTTTVTVTGAALGGFVWVSFSLSLTGLMLTGYVSAADTVTVVLFNPTGAPVDLGSGTIRARVMPV